MGRKSNVYTGASNLAKLLNCIIEPFYFNGDCNRALSKDHVSEHGESFHVTH